MINVDEGDGKPRWLRRRLHAHEEKLPVVLAAENMRARFDDAKIKGHPVLERRRWPLVMADDGGEVVQELPLFPAKSQLGSGHSHGACRHINRCLA